MKHVVLPARGEFGLRIHYHVPAVHALPGPKVVYHERGEEALYPSATELIELPRIEDDQRAGTFPRSETDTLERYRDFARKRWPGAEVVRTEPGMPKERFVPEPHVQIVADVPPVPDVVVCPRWREYGSQKNWPHWPELVVQLMDAGHMVLAAGAPDSSADVPCMKAWKMSEERYLDVTIQAMRTARLVVATDAGLAHLAVLCGADLLVVTYRGLIAPGPVVDSSGRVADESYQRAGWDRQERENRFDAANHIGARIEYVDGWHDVDKVAEMVESW